MSEFRLPCHISYRSFSGLILWGFVKLNTTGFWVLEMLLSPKCNTELPIILLLMQHFLSSPVRCVTSMLFFDQCFLRILTTQCGVGCVWPPPPLAFLLWAFWLSFFRTCRQFASYSKKTIENLQFSVQIKIFPKNTFFCPTTTYSGLCSSDHPCMKILFLVEFLGVGVIYSEKNFDVRRSPPKVM